MLNQPWLTPVWNQAPWFQVDPTIVNKVPKEQEKSCTETVKPKSKGVSLTVFIFHLSPFFLLFFFFGGGYILQSSNVQKHCLFWQGRPRVKVKDKDLFDSFSYPFVEACKRLKIGSTALKRLCRERGIKRWPYRQHRALQKGQAKRAARLAAKGGSSTQACDTRLENKGTETNFEQATKKLVGNVSIQELQAALQNINTNEENGLLQVQR